MKKILIITSIFFNVSQILGQNCINFEGNYPLSNWNSINTDTHKILNDATHGNYLQLTDDSGASSEINSTEFKGNWLTKAGDGCFCFDYKVSWDTSFVTTAPAKGPYLAISDGTYRALFTGHSTNPDVVNGAWGKYCLPIGKADSNNLPFNSYGTWKIYDSGNNLLAGITAETAWNLLITQVRDFILYTDYNSCPSEIVCFDNFCFDCKGPGNSGFSCLCSENDKFTSDVNVLFNNTLIESTQCGKSFNTTLECNKKYLFNFPCTFQGLDGINSCQNSRYLKVYDGNHNLVMNNVPIYQGITFSNPGQYTIICTLEKYGVICKECSVNLTVYCPKKANDCCQNTLNFVTPSLVPPSYPYNNGTYAVEKYNVTTPSSAPITEIKVQVTSFEWLGNDEDCKQCQINQNNLGSLFGGLKIGGVFMPPTYETGGVSSPFVNNNEVIFKLNYGKNISVGDYLQLAYILPTDKNLSCCQTKAKVCRKITFKDINCNVCEIYDCSEVDLKNKTEIKSGFVLPSLTDIYLKTRGINYSTSVDGF